MQKAVLYHPRRALSPLRCPTADQPWWADAHCFLPLLLGPLAFLVTVVQGIAPLLEGHGADCAGVFSRALIRLVVFSAVGYAGGLGIHWFYRLAAAARAVRFDATVGGQATKHSPAKPPASVPVAVWVGIDQVEPGMKLAGALMSEEGQQLAPSGALLTEKIIEAARSAGIGRLAVEGVKYLMPEEEGKEV